MKPVSLLFLCCLANCFFACRKKHPELPVSKLRLDSVAMFQGTKSAISYKFYYDNDGYVIKLVQTSPIIKFVFTDSFVYDASHRLQRHYANASGNGNNIGEYHYDKIGRLTRVNNPSSVGSARIY